jgi:hypothetical protein
MIVSFSTKHVTIVVEDTCDSLTIASAVYLSLSICILITSTRFCQQFLALWQYRALSAVPHATHPLFLRHKNLLQISAIDFYICLYVLNP